MDAQTRKVLHDMLDASIDMVEGSGVTNDRITVDVAGGPIRIETGHTDEGDSVVRRTVLVILAKA